MERLRIGGVRSALDEAGGGKRIERAKVAFAAGRHKLRFFGDRPARFAVIPRDGTERDVRWFEAEPCFIYHVVNAWDDEAFAGACRKTGRRNFVMAGVTTDVCMVSPAISALEEGFNVQVVCDACGSGNPIAEEMSWRRMERAGAFEPQVYREPPARDEAYACHCRERG